MASPEATPIQKLKQLIAEGTTPSPLGETLGFRFLEIAEGTVTIEMTVQEHVLNSMNYLHGGAIAALADTAMGFAAITMLQAGETTTTTEFKINFVRPVFDGAIQCKATVLKHGRVLTLIECEVFDDRRKLIAQALGTCMTLRGEAAKDRSHE